MEETTKIDGVDAQENASGNQGNKDHVAYSTYSKLLGEKKRRDQEVADLRAKVENFETREKQQEEVVLKEKEQFKELFQLKEKELKQREDELQRLRGNIADSKKMRSFLNAVGNLEEEYWNLVDLDKIPLTPEGTPDDTALKAYAENFKERYWKVFTDPNQPKVPYNAPQGGKSTLTYEEWKRLPTAKEKAARLSEVIDQ